MSNFEIIEKLPWFVPFLLAWLAKRLIDKKTSFKIEVKSPEQRWTLSFDKSVARNGIHSARQAKIGKTTHR